MRYLAGGGRRFGETGGAQHGEHKGLELLGLDAGFGEEVGGTEGELTALTGREGAAGIDDEGQVSEGFVLAEPVDQVEAVAVGKADVEDKQMGLEAGTGFLRGL
jgi:hypothetical protein